MAVLDSMFPTIIDVVTAQDRSGAIMPVAELLNQKLEILPDIPWVPGNLPYGHQSQVRISLPKSTTTGFYDPISADTSKRATIVDSFAMIEAVSEIDERLTVVHGSTQLQRLLDGMAQMESMSQEFSRLLFFGDTAVNPKEFKGLYPRYNAISGAVNGENVISAGGSGTDNASIWLVAWGPTFATGIYPANTPVGLSIDDRGLQDKEVAAGVYKVYRTFYRWWCGFHIGDWRAVVRIANIDRSALTFDAATGANLPIFLSQAIERLPPGVTRAAFYCDRDIKHMIRLQKAYLTKESTLTVSLTGGLPVMGALDHQGIPIRTVDTLAADEATVS